MRVYLDHAATAPMPAAVREAMFEAFEVTGNPASTHGHGQAASEILESARERIGRHLGADPAEVILTGGGTESINLALKGIWWARRRQGAGPVVLVAEGEHHATLEAAEWLRDSQGAELHWLPIDADGVLQPEVLQEAIEGFGADRIALVSFLWGNNEVGTVQPVQQLTALAGAAGIPAHVDAVAALGQLPIDFRNSGAAALSLSAHKIGGPPGVGVLLLSRYAQIDPLMHGGSQQRSRAGSQNVPGAVGFAAALDLAYAPGFADRIQALARLRDRLIEGVQQAIPEATLRGYSNPSGHDAVQDAAEDTAALTAAPPVQTATTTTTTTAPTAATTQGRLAGNAHFTFAGCQGDSLVYLLDAAGISASVGSACQAGVTEISHVLLAMGLSETEAAGALRFTLGPDTTEADVDRLLQALPDAVSRARAAGLA